MNDHPTHDQFEHDQHAETRPTDRPGLRRAALIAAPLGVLALGYAVFHREGPANAAPPMPTVTVSQPLVRDISEWDSYVGRFEASRAVEVRPRVSGQITGVHFRDGEMVGKGQLLFTLDARTYSAALAEARAAAASARSDYALARANLARANLLVADAAVSKSDLDQLNARVRAASAAIAAADARVQARALDVSFTQVRAPISGRISDRRVDAGNLVAAGEGPGGSLLTTINAVDPIYFAFDGSEALFLKARRAQASGAVPSEVEVRLQDEADYRWKGRIDFTDNGLDTRSGTIRGRAVMANPGGFLAPGMFGNMRLSSGAKVRAMLVPDAAIGTDQARKTVLTVARDGSVAVKEVTLGPVVDGLRVIRAGLAATDRVIVSGTQAASMPGAKVNTRPGKIAPVAPPVAPPAMATSGTATLAP